ncbi:uncharacterized protein J7T54_002475 [Emericellopsis cladophorae]|uniref:Uncharacterized protein n=1 Tax=Emericellopsis cladophorae TaxID=2686198 RepID=A0A9P9Y311_9HYPO|nr:uncharacterized protein J7T54_002475 [Emericellopsis cladophorae]KAI6782238.1 hypothetical protein J7T54_002475 [Emericellopsis cladophorae]
MAAATYKQFLALPTTSVLDDKASLHYVTTTTSISGATEIVKHLTAIHKQLKKKQEDILTEVEGQDKLALEVDTVIEFLISGGPYLPGLDDNFLSDRTVYLPVTHFVSINPDGRIIQIRLSWDQGALLKQLEVIGKTGRNWPITSSKEQISLIQSCQKMAGGFCTAAGEGANKETASRTRGGSTNALRDPYATLHMQPTREELENSAFDKVVSPYGQKNRPQQRSAADILGDDPTGEHYDDRHAMSPAKAGANRHFQPIRIFEGQEDETPDEDTSETRPASSYIKPHATKYNHFDLADGSDPADAPKPGVSEADRQKTKRDSQWSFEDFVTPAKPKPSRLLRHEDVRHWDTQKADEDDSTAPAQGKGRRDADIHFQLKDDGERAPQQAERGPKRGAVHNEQLGLYKNQLFDQAEPGEDLRALGNITNNKGRSNTFEPHWEATDESPLPDRTKAKPMGHQKAVKMMDSTWDTYDKSPSQKENTFLDADQPENDTRIRIAGDGMGSKKGTNRDWMCGGDDDESPKPFAARKYNASQQRNDMWDF